MTDHTAAVTAINELHRRSFSTPPSADEWSAHDWERDLNAQMLNDGEIESMAGWVMTSETPRDYQNGDWVLRDREGDAVRLDRADGSSIYMAPVGDQYLTWLDRA